MITYTYRAQLTMVNNRYVWALTVDELPGVHSQTYILGEARYMIREAIALHLNTEPDTFALRFAADSYEA